MTDPIYISETGRYSLWYKNTCLKDNLTPSQAADRLLYYKMREDSNQYDWPLEVEHLRIKPYDGIDRTSPRKK